MPWSSTEIHITTLWWGGFYERLVRSVKMSLKKILAKSMLSYEELETVLLKIESVINGCPLGHSFLILRSA